VLSLNVLLVNGFGKKKMFGVVISVLPLMIARPKLEHLVSKNGNDDSNHKNKN